MWCWEGYVEYVMLGKLYDFKCLVEDYEERNVVLYEWFVLLNGEGIISFYVCYFIFVKYVFEVKK